MEDPVHREETCLWGNSFANCASATALSVRWCYVFLCHFRLLCIGCHYVLVIKRFAFNWWMVRRWGGGGGGGGSLQLFFPRWKLTVCFSLCSRSLIYLGVHLFCIQEILFTSRLPTALNDRNIVHSFFVLSLLTIKLKWTKCVCVCVFLKLVVHIFFHANLQPVSQECAQGCSREEAVPCQQGQCSSTAVNTCYTSREGTVNNNLKWDMFFSFCIPRANFKKYFVSDFKKHSEAFRIVFSWPLKSRPT